MELETDLLGNEISAEKLARQQELRVVLEGYDNVMTKVEQYERILNANGLDSGDVHLKQKGIPVNQNRETTQKVMEQNFDKKPLKTASKFDKFVVPKKSRKRANNHLRKLRHEVKQERLVKSSPAEIGPHVSLKENQSAADPVDISTNTELSSYPEKRFVQNVNAEDWFYRRRLPTDPGVCMDQNIQDHDLTRCANHSLTQLNSRVPPPPKSPSMSALSPTLTAFQHQMTRPNLPYRIRFKEDIVIDRRTIAVIRVLVMLIMLSITFYYKVYKTVVNLLSGSSPDWEDFLLSQVAVPLALFILEVFIIWFLTEHMSRFLYYRCEYNFVRACPSVTAYDARQDVHSRADMLHQDPLIAIFRFNKQVQLDLYFVSVPLSKKWFYNEIRVSVELLSQVSTMNQHSLILNKKDVAHRIHAACGATASVNINRFDFLAVGSDNLDIAMNTARVGYGLYLERLETSEPMPFPVSQL